MDPTAISVVLSLSVLNCRMKEHLLDFDDICWAENNAVNANFKKMQPYKREKQGLRYQNKLKNNFFKGRQKVD